MTNPALYKSPQIFAEFNRIYITKITDSMSWNFPDGNVLDYGCGPGNAGFNYLLPRVEATNSHLYSNDISPNMIESATKNFAHPQIQYKTGCFPDNFPFSDLKFDRIFSLAVFHFLRDVTPTLNGLLNVLKPGGQMGITATNINAAGMKLVRQLVDHPEWGEYMADLKETVPDWSDYKNEDPAAFYRNLFFTKTGMKEIYFEFTELKAELEFEPFLDLGISMNPNMSKVPEEKKDALKQYYRHELARLYGVPPDSTILPWNTEFIVVVLEKPA